ncbi:MAG TPA: tetratricopeptide repeat protein [Stellaceae bacterium]|nr:tetratricopeptide repeat protein [Stellaceae bacterium]
MLLGEMVVARGIATVEQVVGALERQRDQGGHLGAHLIAMGVLTSRELSALLVEQNDARTAIPFCEQTLTRWEGEFGVHHPATARARCNLAHALLADGRAEEALAAALAAVMALRANYGDDHAWTRAAMTVHQTAHHAVHGPQAAELARLRAVTKQAEPQKA